MDDESGGKKSVQAMVLLSYEGKRDDLGSGLYQMSALDSEANFGGKSSY